MTRLTSLILLTLHLPLFATAASGDALLPGFRAEPVASLEGFATSVVTDSKGAIYVTTTDGWIHRVDGTHAVRVASVPTRPGSNGGLLGMALLDDNTAVVHYTAWGDGNVVLDDMIARIDLTTGIETVLRAFACDIEVHDRGASPEHHGGNPIVAPDGSIFVGIGDYGSYAIAQLPEWNAGKIWRIDPTGHATQWARGVRNPFDLAWDPELGRLVVADNGPEAGDEVHVIAEGSNCGWPKTYGHQPPVDGMVPPDYVFDETIAPTGLLRLDGANPTLRTGYLLGAFVPRALLFFPTLTAPVAHPVAIIDRFDEAIIDVTQAPTGELFFVSASFEETTTVWRLVPPARGDCDGNGVVDWRDLFATNAELADGGAHPAFLAHEGGHRGSWGCDADGDLTIDADDLDALRRILSSRRRAVGVP